jgi:hypothetical protein
MIAGEYSRVLVPGGRILIQNDNVLFGFADGKWDSVLKPYLPALFPDFFWHRLRLKDICKIHIPENEYQAVRKNEKSLVSGGVMPEIRLSRFSDNPVANKQRCIRIDASKHYGPDFYILTKRPDLLG